MNRIAVIGCGGSGKSHLARRLAKLLGPIPLTHLDAVFYDRDWNPLPHDAFVARQEQLVAESRWIIDGNYASTLPIRLAAADTVVFLDLPALVCLWGIAQRRFTYRGGQHVKDGVYDRITWSFVRYIWGYRTHMRPCVQALLAEHSPRARLVSLSSRRATNRFLNQVAARAAEPVRLDQPAQD